MPDLKLIHLNDRDLAEAYPLARSAVRVGLHQWQAFGQKLIAAGGGIIAVQAADSCIHGLATFRPVASLRHDFSLNVEILIAFELGSHGPVRTALCAALDEIGRSKGCRNILFTLSARSYSDPTSASRLGCEAIGLKMETVGFVRTLS